MLLCVYMLFVRWSYFGVVCCGFVIMFVRVCDVCVCLRIKIMWVFPLFFIFYFSFVWFC